MEKSDKKCLKASEVAEILQISRARVYELAREGILPHTKLGRQIRFSKDQLEEFIKNGGKALPGGWKWENDEDHK